MRQLERQLVCEGKCNENLVARFDAGVRQGFRSEAPRRYVPGFKMKPSVVLLPEWAQALVKHLKHTIHVRLNAEQSVCMTCHTIRRYALPDPEWTAQDAEDYNGRMRETGFEAWSQEQSEL